MDMEPQHLPLTFGSVPHARTERCWGGEMARCLCGHTAGVAVP